MTGRGPRGWMGATPAVAILATLLLPATTVQAQESTVRDRARAMEFEPVIFDQPEPERYDVLGVPVLLLTDDDLPLVTALVSFKGGYGLFPRSEYAAATALPSLLRSGGTSTMPPDSVDAQLERYAIQLGFGSGGGSISSSMNVLTEHLAPAFDLWGTMLTEPGLDQGEIEIWRGRQLESISRRPDDPGTLAFSEFNRLLYGDHPIGWDMTPDDLKPDHFDRTALLDVHGRVVCRENMLLGVTGDATWTESRALVESFVARVPPCAEPLPEAPIPEVARDPGVYVLHKETDQAVVVLAHPTDLPLADRPDYFSATIGNAILGSGGFSSRLMTRVRTEEGFAYSASSLWTTPRRYPGLLGAVTRTRPETAVDAVRVIRETMREFQNAPPTNEEVDTTVDQIVHGWVFNFESAAQIVSRSMFYLQQDLPGDWLERYLRGVQRVGPDDVAQVFAEHLRPDDMTILIVGDTARLGRSALESLGPIRILPSPR